MSSPHKEITFGDEICDHLAGHGWHYQPVLISAAVTGQIDVREEVA
jgi:hypothetical protein